MSGENDSESIFKYAAKMGRQPLILTKRVGEMALTTAGEVYAGKPAANEPHITERLRSEKVVTDALIGKQFVELGALNNPALARSDAEARDIKEKRRGYRLWGHYKIVKAALEAVADPQVKPDQIEQVVTIAKESGTDPSRLEPMLTPDEQRQAELLIEPQAQN